MKPPLVVLVLPGGTELGLEVRQALDGSPDVRLSSAGQPGSSHAPFVYERHLPLPSVHAPGWLPALRECIATEGIDYVYPAHDDVLLALAEHAAELGAGLVTSPLETCRVARSKRATYELLSEVVPVPAIVPELVIGPDPGVAPDPSVAPDPGAPARFPVFVKPDCGQGSRDARLVRDAAELERALATTAEPLVMEYLPGREFTVDCFSDRERGLLFSGGRERLRTRNGIATHTVTCNDARFAEYAARIGERLVFHGAWFFQLREDTAGELVLLEVAPRIAGGSGLQRARGVNLPWLALREQERLPVEPRTCTWSVELSRALASRVRLDFELDEVRVALEDTLVRAGRLDSLLVAFLLEARARGARLVLLTEDQGVAASVLATHRLSELCDACELHGTALAEPAPAGSSPAATPRVLVIDNNHTRRARIPREIPALDSSVAAALLEGRA